MNKVISRTNKIEITKKLHYMPNGSRLFFLGLPVQVERIDKKLIK